WVVEEVAGQREVGAEHIRGDFRGAPAVVPDMRVPDDESYGVVGTTQFRVCGRKDALHVRVRDLLDDEAVFFLPSLVRASIEPCCPVPHSGQMLARARRRVLTKLPAGVLLKLVSEVLELADSVALSCKREHRADL